jgi:hypothetical protein
LAPETCFSYSTERKGNEGGGTVVKSDDGFRSRRDHEPAICF